MTRLLPLWLLILATAGLAGCDQLGIESPEKVAAQRDGEGKAIGGACRHAGRAIEDCYVLNKKADKAAMFAGWREMNDYMRENKIDVVEPQIAGKPPAPKPEEAAEEPVPAKATGGKAKDAKGAKHES